MQAIHKGIYKEEKCANCGKTKKEKYECPCCCEEFCGACLTVPSGADSKTIKCPCCGEIVTT